jgi:2-oxoglutarate ferredoxin oxidoreductase subunit beta
VARTLDSDRKQLTEVLRAAAHHRGSALVEIYQGCPIFNDGAFDVLKDAEESQRRIIPLKHGEQIKFGKDQSMCVVREGLSLAVRKVDEVNENDIVVHDETLQDPSYAFALSRIGEHNLNYTTVGVYRSVNRPAYDDQARFQVTQATEAKAPDLQSLLTGKDTWTVA